MKRSEIYLEAARRVVEGDYGAYTNPDGDPDIAIGTTAPGDYGSRDPERDYFRETFDVRLGDFSAYATVEEGVLALCFMAAIAEAEGE